MLKISIEMLYYQKETITWQCKILSFQKPEPDQCYQVLSLADQQIENKQYHKLNLIIDSQ